MMITRIIAYVQGPGKFVKQGRDYIRRKLKIHTFDISFKEKPAPGETPISPVSLSRVECFRAFCGDDDAASKQGGKYPACMR